MFSNMVRRKGELSQAKINAGWPHQVALPADACKGAGYVATHEFCRGLSLCPRGRSFRRDDRDYVVFCFSYPAHAQAFRERFGGELVTLKAR